MARKPAPAILILSNARTTEALPVLSLPHLFLHSLNRKEAARLKAEPRTHRLFLHRISRIPNSSCILTPAAAIKVCPSVRSANLAQGRRDRASTSVIPVAHSFDRRRRYTSYSCDEPRAAHDRAAGHLVLPPPAFPALVLPPAVTRPSNDHRLPAFACPAACSLPHARRGTPRALAPEQDRIGPGINRVFRFAPLRFFRFPTDRDRRSRPAA
ncbi:hypothetical protein CALVIDRAFT_98173 [Calocera viscosa TUFC12733]|uniref:Uncharacterized protein n=1 Tax=Calocera viscosa (strain TUFC12733) TaxID=1330018 RepID=A0A167MJJ0_CALVF|nr:hypothetical protein CALVIDRAFT_98173 [Calocera viscosa TUFC12733]